MKKNLRKMIALGLSAAILLICVSCTQSNPPSGTTPAPGSAQPAAAGSDTVKIGILYPLSGSTATAGQSAAWTCEWIADFINNELGGLQSMGGAKIELVIGDSRGDSETALSEFERMTNVENVSAMFGIYNTAVANTLSQYCIANQVPAVFTNAIGDDAYSTPNKYVFHANGTNSTGAVLETERSEWMREQGIDMRVYAIVYDAADYGRDSYETALANMEVNKVDEIVGVPITAGSADFSAEIMKLKENPAIEFVAPIMSMNDAILFLRQMKDYDVALPIFASGGGFLQGDFIQQVGDASDYVFSSALWFPSMIKVAWDRDLAQRVYDDYTAKFGYDFDESASNAWLGFWCLWDALERAGTADRESLAAALKETDISGDHYATLLSSSKTVKFEDKENRGIWNYNQNQDVPNPWGMILDGEYHVLWPEHLVAEGDSLIWPIPSWSERG